MQQVGGVWGAHGAKRLGYPMPALFRDEHAALCGAAARESKFAMATMKQDGLYLYKELSAQAAIQWLKACNPDRTHNASSIRATKMRFKHYGEAPWIFKGRHVACR